jgi:helicase
VLDDLRALVEFAQAGSIAGAADRLFRTPSAITRQLQRLEAALGAELLDRSRFLPWPSGQMKPESSVFMQRVTHLTAWDRTNEHVTRCVHAMGLFIQGEAERKIRFVTGVSAGNLHRLSNDIAWILDGLSCVSGASDLGCPQVVTNNIGMLSRRVRWGAPAEALDVLRIANRRNVPGFGRQRVMALIANGLATVMDVIGAGKARLVKLLGGATN